MPYSNHDTVPRPRGFDRSGQARRGDGDGIDAAGRDGRGGVGAERPVAAPRRADGIRCDNTEVVGDPGTEPREPHRDADGIRPGSGGLRVGSRPVALARAVLHPPAGRAAVRVDRPRNGGGRRAERARRAGDDGGRGLRGERQVGAARGSGAVGRDHPVVVRRARRKASQLFRHVDLGGAVPRAPRACPGAVGGRRPVLDGPAGLLPAGTDLPADDGRGRADRGRGGRDRGRCGRRGERDDREREPCDPSHRDTACHGASLPPFR